MVHSLTWVQHSGWQQDAIKATPKKKAISYLKCPTGWAPLADPPAPDRLCSFRTPWAHRSGELRGGASQSATGGGAFIQLISANRITSQDSINSKEFPLNHLSRCREQRRLWRLITRARLFYVSKRRSGVIVKAYIRHLRLKIKRVKY